MAIKSREMKRVESAHIGKRGEKYILVDRRKYATSKMVDEYQNGS